MQRTPKGNQKAQSANTQPQFGMYCGSFRTSPKPANSWLAPVVAPVQADTVVQPSEYRFASRAPVVRRSPSASTKRNAAKNPSSNTAHHGQRPVPSTSSYSSQHQHQRHYDSDSNQYDEFLAMFQHRIDGMTGQRGGWGF